MTKKYILNMETSKIELQFTKAEFKALTPEQQAEIKSNYLFSGKAQAWVSRSTQNHYWAIKTAQKLGFEDGGRYGERLTYAEQLEVKADKAEARAERFEQYAGNAQDRARELQKELKSHHGDISFFTQPNINSSGGRAFTSYRERITHRYEKGFNEYRKSEYYLERAQTAQETASMAQLKSKAYLDNRIKECNAEIRGIQRRLDGSENEEYIGRLLERMEIQIDKLAFMQNCLDELGGIAYSQENVKAGYWVKVRRDWELVIKANKTTVETRILSGGAAGMQYKKPYAEITEVKIPEDYTEEAQKTVNPFKVGDIVTQCQIGSSRIMRAYQIVKTTAKMVTVVRIDVVDGVPQKDKFTGSEQIKKGVKKDYNGNIVVNNDNWNMHKYTA